MSSVKYPIGIQNFRSLRDEGFVYVDKTALIYDLVNENKYIFLARPRRFGKSLLLSTIQAYFNGNEHLFKDLEIAKLEKNWISYPVFHLKLASVNPDSHDALKAVVDTQFSEWEKDLDIKNQNLDFASRFSTILKESFRSTGKQAVILVDEYDNPLINSLNDQTVHESNRNMLKSIYSNLKDQDEYIRFGMLTGVSRFSKMSVFSGINNLNDISFVDKYSSICGFTLNEIRGSFNEGVALLAHTLKISNEEALDTLKRHYDGYHFSINSEDIYNPFSLLKCLQQSKLGAYWLETATPSFIVEILKKSSLPFTRIFNSEAKETALTESDTSFSSPMALLYQTGYLTLKGYDHEKKRYMVGIPNEEVEAGLFPYLLSGFTRSDLTLVDDVVNDLKLLITGGNPQKFLSLLQSFLADIPTFASEEKTSERYFEHTLYLIFRSMGLQVSSQKATSFSRSDLIISAPGFIYIFEIKTQGTPEKALRQIEEKQYALPYLNLGKKIFKIGLIFSKKKRNISRWVIQPEE